MKEEKGEECEGKGLTDDWRRDGMGRSRGDRGGSKEKDGSARRRKRSGKRSRRALGHAVHEPLPAGTSSASRSARGRVLVRGRRACSPMLEARRQIVFRYDRDNPNGSLGPEAPRGPPPPELKKK